MLSIKKSMKILFCKPRGPDVGLEYVGQERGDFAMAPQMKYVGYGGDYSARRAVGFLCLLLRGPLLLLFGLLAWLFWPVDECKQGFENWQINWTQDKIWQCCAKGSVPCPTQPPAPLAMGPFDPYNSALRDLNWKAGWSTVQKIRCCSEHGKGCGLDGPAVAILYDCNAGTENWVKGWSENKKQ